MPWSDELPLIAEEISEALRKALDARRDDLGDVSFDISGMTMKLNREATETWLELLMEYGLSLIKCSNGLSNMRGAKLVKPKDIKNALKLVDSGWVKDILGQRKD